jgi:hypothetical protein
VPWCAPSVTREARCCRWRRSSTSCRCVAEAGPDGELDRAAVFHRARLALRGADPGGRSLLWVDDVDHLDELSLAVLASLVVARGRVRRAHDADAR